MSIPAFAWAMAKGRELQLATGLRMLLIAITDRANGTRACYAGQECLAKDTGLTSRSIRDLAPQLEQLGLIRMERRGKLIYYHVLRPGVAGNGHQTAEASSGKHRKPVPPSTPEANSGKHRQSVPVSAAGNGADTGSETPQHRKSASKIPEATSDKPYLNQENLKSARDRAQAAVPAAEPEGVDSRSEEAGKATAPQPAPAPTAPALGTTTGSGGDSPPGAFRPPGRSDPFPSDDPSVVYLDRLLGKRSPAAARVVEEVVREEPAPDREQMIAQFEQLQAELAAEAARRLKMRAYPPGRRPVRDVGEQIAAARPAQPLGALSAAQLAAVRRAAGYWQPGPTIEHAP
jgi:hypothetical protein